MALIRPQWVTVRTFVAVAAEGHAVDPVVGVFVQAPEPIEEDLLIDFSGGTFAGAPNSANFWIWSRHDDKSTIVTSKMAEVIVAGADSGHITPVIVRNGPALIYITVDAFNGGAGPTFSGTVRMRRLAR